MKITSIKAQAKNPERINIYVDEKYAFSLNYNQLLDQKIHAGLQVDQPRIDQLKHLSEVGKAYERALNYVMIRPRSERELRDYARRKKWAPADTEDIIQKLKDHRYLNDAAFAKAWVESRALNKKISQRKLRLELKQKGVTDDIINQTLAASTYDEQAALRELVAKKRKLARFAADDQKLMQYLARQGFSFDDIKQALSCGN